MIRILTSYVITLLSILSLSFCPALAQQTQFSVASFELDPFDVSAQSPEYEKIDASGNRYAIIKVTSQTPDEGLKEYQFNFGMMNSLVEERENALWLYVQKNAKHVTIRRRGYAPVEKYDLQTTIQAGKTYRMVLSSTGPVVYQQMVLFDIMPKDAETVVMIAPEGGSERLLGIQDESGSVAQSLPLGTYTYRVMAKMYRDSEGRITLNDRKQTHVEKVVLVPNFSTVTLETLLDVGIYVNGIKKGKKSWTGKLQPGTYQVECRAPHYRSSTQSVNVSAVNQHLTFRLTPPTPIQGTLAVTSTPLGAEILIDGVKHGVTPQNIDLLEGKHQLTLQKDKFEPTRQSFELVENQVANVHLNLKKEEPKPVLTEQRTSPRTLAENSELWVDLGLSVLWATHNVGANSPEEYGDYFAWGEIRPKAEYTEKNSLTYEKFMDNIGGNPKYDAATAQWGAPARLPTKEEFKELMRNTNYGWKVIKGVRGYLFTSEKTGNSIFLPAAGQWTTGTSPWNTMQEGYYWGSTPDEYNDSAYYLYIGSLADCNTLVRYSGHSVRPVRDK